MFDDESTCRPRPPPVAPPRRPRQYDFSTVAECLAAPPDLPKWNYTITPLT